MSETDDDFRLRTRHVRGGRRPGRGAKADAPLDAAGLPEVVEMVGKWVRVHWPDGREQRCKVKDTVVCGDRVVIEDDLVVAHAPRHTELRRGGNSGIRVVCANADVLLLVMATQDPPFRTGLVDRMLVAASAAGMDAWLVLNKCDTGMPEEVLEAVARYEALGVRAFLVSAALQKGFEPLCEAMVGHTGVLSGHSGVGKSSILQALVPGVQRSAGELDEWGRGRHTTTSACTFDIPTGGRLVDLPGVREYGVEFVLKEELRRHFSEMAELPCQYADCLHREDEEGCVADELVEEGRLESYRKLLEELA